MSTTTRFTTFALTMLLAACGNESATTNGSPTGNPGQSATAAKSTEVGRGEAKALFDTLCFTCHGKTGLGDGPGAAQLEPKPRSFADAAWQDSVTDEHIRKVIVFGGAAVGKSPMMVAQPQLKGKDDVLNALVEIVRGFRPK